MHLKRILPNSLFACVFLFSASAFSQPRIAVEVSGGAGLGFNPYVDNVVILDSDVPVLVDELPGPGLHFQLSFLFSELELSGGIQLFNRNVLIQHHRGTSTISPRDRQRPDGSIDDSGVDYVAVEETRIETSAKNGDLLMGKIGAGYRFYLLDDTFRFYIPVSTGLVFLTILEPTQPLKTGLFLDAGVGSSVEVADPISIFIDARINGAITPSYAPLSDAARTSFLNDESTEGTLFSSFLSATFLIGFQVTIR